MMLLHYISKCLHVSHIYADNENSTSNKEVYQFKIEEKSFLRYKIVA